MFASLRVRIFMGLVLSLGIAGATGLIVERMLRVDELEHPARTTARTLQSALEATWDDPVARNRVLDDTRRTTGLELRIIEGSAPLPRPARRAKRRENITFGPQGDAYIPILPHGDVVALVEFRPPRPSAPPRAFIALGVALVALAIVAYVLSRRLTTPLENVAKAARAFGGGTLSARVGPEGAKASSEVAALSQAFDQMAGRIEHLVLDQRALLQAISHELRSPLGRARIHLELARDRSPDPALDKVEREIVNLDSILSDLLLAARTGLSDVRKEPHNIEAWLQKAAQEEAHGLTLEVSYQNRESPSAPQAAVPVVFDAQLLRRALANLIRNAERHGHPKAMPLRIDCVQQVDSVELSVTDRGPGFGPDILDRAFEPFVRGDVARAPSGGSGLGLSLVRRIAEAHGGAVGAENVVREGAIQGARVWFQIPA